MSISLIPLRLYPSCQLIQLINHLEKKLEGRANSCLHIQALPILFSSSWKNDVKRCTSDVNSSSAAAILKCIMRPGGTGTNKGFVTLHEVVVAGKLPWRTSHRSQNEHISTNSRTGCSIQCLSGSK